MRNLIIATVLAVAMLIAAGCADKNAPKPADVESWIAKADNATGVTPADIDPIPTIEEVIVDEPQIIGPSKSPVRELPRKKITLSMRDADVVGVIKALGKAVGQGMVISPSVVGKVNIDVVDIPWNQVFDSVVRSNRLSWTWEGRVISVGTIEDVQSQIAYEELKEKRISAELAAQSAAPLYTGIVKIRYGSAESMKGYLENFLTVDQTGKRVGTVQVDPENHSLVVSAIHSDLDKLLKMIRRLDVPKPQINIKAHIVEATRTASRELGIKWGGSFTGNTGNGNNLYVNPGGSPGNPTLANGDTGNSGNGFAANFSPEGFAANGNGLALGLMFGVLGGNILEMQLQAMEEDNKIKILSSPSLTTMDNQPAFTEAGEKVPYVSSSDNEGTNVKFEDATLRLEITPHVVDREFIRLDILVQKDEVDTSRSVDGNPFITKKKTKTTLVVRNTDTVVISGLTKHRSIRSGEGIPGLKDSAVGGLFGTTSRNDVKDQFLIFITPTVLKTWSAKKTEE